MMMQVQACMVVGWGTIRKIRLEKEGWYLLDRKPIAVVEIFVQETGEPTVYLIDES